MPAAPEELLALLDVRGTAVEIEPLAHNPWLTSGIWRVRTNSGLEAVLKHTRADRPRGATPWDAHWTAHDREPRRWTYWPREVLAYRAHLAGAFEGSGLSAPACLATLIDDRQALLLAEWVRGTAGESWPLATYGAAAEALGRAQAPFLGGRPLPAAGWLSRGFLRSYSSEKPVDWDLLDDDTAWGHPLVRETFPPGLREAVLFLHAHRERLYRVSEALPRTLCHLDFWPKNLFVRPGGEVVLVDWAFVGEGAIGEDVGNLVPDAAFDHFAASDDLAELEEVVAESYLRGLRTAGWRGDPRLVRLGMWATSVKYDWLAPATLASVGATRHVRYGGAAEIDPRYRLRERSRALLFNAGWARRAVELAEQLGM